MEIRRARYDDPEARELVSALADELLARYDGWDGSGGEHEPADFDPPAGAFLVAADAGRVLGCGGVCRSDDETGEIRRMYVVPEARGRGIGRLLLAALEAEARELGYRRVRLEAGDRQPEALALYRSAGFEPIPRFGPWVDVETSRCLEKRLTLSGA